jgi:hypothetical protein
LPFKGKWLSQHCPALPRWHVIGDIGSFLPSSFMSSLRACMLSQGQSIANDFSHVEYKIDEQLISTLLSALTNLLQMVHENSNCHLCCLQIYRKITRKFRE